eukprot:NODE_8986_length_359_cov_282.092105.p1 GENE.NODE_8986_length_359_cov_282.092105~~NODE_8986_length_359_cov_282.092105.p1  ORF type:complete len:80 (+),score=15.08 NODE_8986_length_359_cov_282.092105:3-242(+)
MGFQEEQIEAARVVIGTYRVWVAQGIRSNRIMYAAKKRGDVQDLPCLIVPAPERDDEDDDGGDHPDTYGSDLTKIQLIP